MTVDEYNSLLAAAELLERTIGDIEVTISQEKEAFEDRLADLELQQRSASLAAQNLRGVLRTLPV